MDKRLVILRKICGFLYTGGILFLITELLLGVFHRRPLSAGHLALFWCIVLVVSLLREKVGNIMEQFLFHLGGAAAVYFFVGDKYVRWLLILTIGMLFILAAGYIRRGYVPKPVGEMPWPVFLLAVAVVGYGMYMKSSFLMRIGYIIPLILFILYLVMMYLDGMERYVNATRDTSGIPREKMLFANSILIGGILLTAVFLIILFNALGISGSFVRAGSWLKSVCRLGILCFMALMKFLYSFLFRGSYKMPQGDASTLTKKANKTLKGAQSLEVFLKLFILALAVWLMYRIIRYLMRAFLTRYRHVDEYTEKLEKKPVTALGKKEKMPGRVRLGGSPEERLRRLYRKKILSRKDDYKPKDYDTTEMIAEKLLANAPSLSGEELETLTKAYQSVRYGNHIPEKEELRSLRKLLR